MRGRPRFGTRKRFGTLNEEQTCDVGPYPAPADAASVERFKPLLNWPAAAHWAAPAISTVAANGMGCGNWSRRTLSVAGRTHRRESPIGATQRAIVRHRLRSSCIWEWDRGHTCNPGPRSPAFSRGRCRDRCSGLAPIADVQTILKCASTGWQARPLIGKTSWGHAEKAMTRSISARSLT